MNIFHCLFFDGAWNRNIIMDEYDVRFLFCFIHLLSAILIIHTCVHINNPYQLLQPFSHNHFIVWILRKGKRPAVGATSATAVFTAVWARPVFLHTGTPFGSWTLLVMTRAICISGCGAGLAALFRYNICLMIYDVTLRMMLLSVFTILTFHFYQQFPPHLIIILNGKEERLIRSYIYTTRRHI